MSDSVELIKFLASFGILTLMLYALYYYLNGMQKKFQKSGKVINIAETKMVGKNRFLHIVDIEEERFLIASDEQGIKILKEWKKEDKVE